MTSARLAVVFLVAAAATSVEAADADANQPSDAQWVQYAQASLSALPYHEHGAIARLSKRPPRIVRPASQLLHGLQVATLCDDTVGDLSCVTIARAADGSTAVVGVAWGREWMTIAPPPKLLWERCLVAWGDLRRRASIMWPSDAAECLQEVRRFVEGTSPTRRFVSRRGDRSTNEWLTPYWSARDRHRLHALTRDATAVRSPSGSTDVFFYTWDSMGGVLLENHLILLPDGGLFATANELCSGLGAAITTERDARRRDVLARAIDWWR